MLCRCCVDVGMLCCCCVDVGLIVLMICWCCVDAFGVVLMIVWIMTGWCCVADVYSRKKKMTIFLLGFRGKTNDDLQFLDLGVGNSLGIFRFNWLAAPGWNLDAEVEERKKWRYSDFIKLWRIWGLKREKKNKDAIIIFFPPTKFLGISSFFPFLEIEIIIFSPPVGKICNFCLPTTSSAFAQFVILANLLSSFLTLFNSQCHSPPLIRPTPPISVNFLPFSTILEFSWLSSCSSVMNFLPWHASTVYHHHPWCGDQQWPFRRKSWIFRSKEKKMMMFHRKEGKKNDDMV